MDCWWLRIAIGEFILYAPFKEAALMADLDGFGSHKSSVVSRPLLLDIDGCRRLSPYQHIWKKKCWWINEYMQWCRCQKTSNTKFMFIGRSWGMFISATWPTWHEQHRSVHDSAFQSGKALAVGTCCDHVLPTFWRHWHPHLHLLNVYEHPALCLFLTFGPGAEKPCNVAATCFHMSQVFSQRCTMRSAHRYWSWSD